MLMIGKANYYLRHNSFKKYCYRYCTDINESEDIKNEFNKFNKEFEVATVRSKR